MSISLLFITFVIFSVADLPSCFSADTQYEECRLPLVCGDGRQVLSENTTYPSWGLNKREFCGEPSFQLSCEDNKTLSVYIGDLKLRVKSVNLKEQVITVVDQSWLGGNCSKILNFTGEKEFIPNLTTDKIDIYDCKGNISSFSNISCRSSDDRWETYRVFGPPSYNPVDGCIKAGEIPILESAKNVLYQSKDSNGALGQALEQGFDLKYSIDNHRCQACTNSSGICWSGQASENFQCLCEDKPYNSSCYYNKG